MRLLKASLLRLEFIGTLSPIIGNIGRVFSGTEAVPCLVLRPDGRVDYSTPSSRAAQNPLPISFGTSEGHVSGCCDASGASQPHIDKVQRHIPASRGSPGSPQASVEMDPGCLHPIAERHLHRQVRSRPQPGISVGGDLPNSHCSPLSAALPIAALEGYLVFEGDLASGGICHGHGAPQTRPHACDGVGRPSLCSPRPEHPCRRQHIGTENRNC